MLNRTAVSAALTGLALTGALCACGSATQHSGPAGAGASVPSSATAPAGPSSPGRSRSPAPVIFAVRLGPGFQPGTLRISPGQHFVVTVDSSVRASGPDVPGSCPGTTTRIDGGMLTMRCTSGVFTYCSRSLRMRM
jgi:hypothetical protein